MAAIHATEGRGVDVGLNYLTGDLLHTSLEACADFGRFVGNRKEGHYRPWQSRHGSFRPQYLLHGI